jgi:hypothetical protein
MDPRHWTLYLAPGTCAQATHIALCEAQAPVQLGGWTSPAASSAARPFWP